MSRAPVLVAGGGIAALALGILGTRRGLEVRLFEQAESLRIGGGALVMWPNAMSVLAQVGLADAVLAAGTRIERAVFQTVAARLLQSLRIDSMCDDLKTPAVVVPRRCLMEILHEAAGLGAIQFGARLVGFDDRGGSVVAHFEDGTTAEGSVLIGADGLRSVVRSRLHRDEPPRAIGQTAWVGIADLAHPDLPPGWMVGTLGVGQRFWATRVQANRTYWYAIVSEPVGGGKKVPTRSELLRAFDGWHEPVQTLIESTREHELVTTSICDRPPLELPWGRGRATLLGDAAHPVTPDLGQGACQAIEGAAVLAACLVDQPDPVRALRRYESLRAPRTAVVGALSRLIAIDSMSTKPHVHLRRDAVLRMTPPRIPLGILRRVVDQPPPP